MVHVMFLVLLSSFLIISGAEAHYIINLEISAEPRVVKPKIPREFLFLDETLNVRIVSEIALMAKVKLLLCYIGEERPSYYFASVLIESKTEKNSYNLDYNLFVHKDMKGIWYCTLLFDRDPILFELDVYVASLPNEVSRNAEIASATDFYSKVVAPTKIYHDKGNLAKIKRGVIGNGVNPKNTYSDYKIDTEPDTYDYDGSGAEMTSNTNEYMYGHGEAPQNTHSTYKTDTDYNRSGWETIIYFTIGNTNSKHIYTYGEPPQNTGLSYGTNPLNTSINGTTNNKLKNDRNNLAQPENVNKTKDESVVNIKTIWFLATAAGSGILIGTIGVLCRKKCKTPDNEPIVSFTTSDPVYDDVYSAESDVANRPPHPLSFEEREENKPYIHYDTPYDHRCEWRPPPQVVTFMK